MTPTGYATIPRAVIGRIAKIGPTGFAVYAVLAGHADDTDRCWPSVAAIAQIVGCSEPTVKRALRTLKDHGLISQQRRRQSVPVYTIQEVSPVTPQCQEVSPVIPRGITSDLQEVSPVIHGTNTKERTPKNEGARRTKSRPKFDPLAVELPFDAPRFRSGWADFCEHRRLTKHPLTEAAVKRILAKLERWGEAKAVEALDTSIENGWRGVFEPKAAGKAAGHQPQKCKVLTPEEYLAAGWNPHTGGNL